MMLSDIPSELPTIPVVFIGLYIVRLGFRLVTRREVRWQNVAIDLAILCFLLLLSLTVKPFLAAQ
jgi:hypothetical protein